MRNTRLISRVKEQLANKFANMVAISTAAARTSHDWARARQRQLLNYRHGNQQLRSPTREDMDERSGF
jgi:hypothetical protein